MKINLLKADITTVPADAIVNAANSSLMGGGGVDGAIHRRGGPAILEACREIVRRQGPCAPGDAVITTAGDLPADCVIHTVGPIWNGGGDGEADLLASCYRSCLDITVGRDIRSISFPNISTGVYRFPKRAAAEIAISAVRSFPFGDRLETLNFVCFDDENHAIYEKLI